MHPVKAPVPNRDPKVNSLHLLKASVPIYRARVVKELLKVRVRVLKELLKG